MQYHKQGICDSAVQFFVEYMNCRIDDNTSQLQPAKISSIVIWVNHHKIQEKRSIFVMIYVKSYLLWMIITNTAFENSFACINFILQFLYSSFSSFRSQLGHLTIQFLQLFLEFLPWTSVDNDFSVKQRKFESPQLFNKQDVL